MQGNNHLGVHHRHNMLREFGQRDMKSACCQLLNHFQPDESRPDDNSVLRGVRSRIDSSTDTIHVRERTERVNTRRLRASHRRNK